MANRKSAPRRPIAKPQPSSPISFPSREGENFPGAAGQNFPGNLKGWDKAVFIVLPEDIVKASQEKPLCASLLLTALGYFPGAEKHLHHRASGSPEWIFIWCLGGEGWCEVGGRTLTVSGGELLIIPENTPHSYGAAPLDAWTIAWWHAVGHGLPEFLGEFGLQGAGKVRIGFDPYALELFQHIQGIVEGGYSSLRVIRSSHALAHLLCSLMGCARAEQQPSGMPRYMARIARSIAFARENLANPLTVADMASVANLSEAYFAGLFHQQTGFAPLDYFIRLRLHRACQLLDTTDQPIRRIAEEVGYADPLYFSRAFRAVNKLSPRAYRERENRLKSK